jgi:hypothetical protein
MGGAMGGGAGAAGGAATASVGPILKNPPPDRRNDPFAPWWPAPPPPPAISLVDPVRIATLRSYEAPPPEPVQVNVIPNQRVAGILTGNGVYALIDGGGENQYVVKPGDPVGEYRVDRINADSVTLKRTVGTLTYTQVIPLSDAGSMARMGMGGGAGMPSGGMPRGMRPGAGMMMGGKMPGGGGANVGND